MSKTTPPVLDVCCGTRAMWFDKRDTRALFADQRTEQIYIAPGRAYRNGAILEVRPDLEADFTNLPFDDESFFHVVFDPPHHTSKRLGNGQSGVIEKKYGSLQPEWRRVISDGFKECFRVLKPNGTLIFKWCSVEIPLKEVLALTSENPLYGHRSGKRAQTHWVAFLKHKC